MKKRTRIILIIISAVFLGLVIFFVANYPAKQCDSINFAWGAQKTECSCRGIKIDTSCGTKLHPCPDAPSTTGCIGKITERRCYSFNGWNNTSTTDEWTQIPCVN
jgi:hypothetical protein